MRLHNNFTGVSYLRKHRWIVPLLMFALVLLIYSNTFFSPFVFDDTANILDNPQIRLRSFNLDELMMVVLDNLIPSRPVAYFSFALNYYFHEYRLPGYHLINILIHFSAGIALYYFLKMTLTLMLSGHEFSPKSLKLSGSRQSDKPDAQIPTDSVLYMVPFFSAMIWVAHPLAIQSVTYIVQRMNSMAAMFYIFSMLFYVKARMIQRSGPAVYPPSSNDTMGYRADPESLPAGHPKGWVVLCYTGCVLSAVAAIASKEIAATLPFFILLYEWYFFQDLDRKWLKQYVLFFLAAIVVLNLLIVIFAWDDIMSRLAPGYALYDFTPRQRVLTQFRVIFFYLGLLVFPAPWRLNLEHEYSLSFSLFDPLTTLVAVLAATGLIVISILTAKRQRLLSFAILWFFGNLVIESSIIPLDMVFEHRTYLPSMITIFAAVYYLFRGSPRRLINITFCTSVIMLFSLWTYERNSTWSDKVSLWQDCVQKSPGIKRPYNNLGLALLNVGEIDQSVVYLARALAIDEDYPDANGNMGLALYEKGFVDESIAYLNKAIAGNPNLLHVHINMGNALLSKGLITEGIQHYEKAIQLDWSSALALRNLGLARLRQGKMKAAMVYFTRAIEVDPNDQEAIISRNQAKKYIEEFIRGVEVLEKTMAVDPLHPEIETNVQAMRRQRSDLDRTMEQYVISLSRQAGFSKKEIDEENNMGPLYRAKSKYDAIYPLFERLGQVQNHPGMSAYVRASIYALQEHPDRAIQELKKSISMGFDDRDRMAADVNLKHISHLPEFKQLLDSI